VNQHFYPPFYTYDQNKKIKKVVSTLIGQELEMAPLIHLECSIFYFLFSWQDFRTIVVNSKYHEEGIFFATSTNVGMRP